MFFLQGHEQLARAVELHFISCSACDCLCIVVQSGTLVLDVVRAGQPLDKLAYAFGRQGVHIAGQGFVGLLGLQRAMDIAHRDVTKIKAARESLAAGIDQHGVTACLADQVHAAKTDAKPVQNFPDQHVAAGRQLWLAAGIRPCFGVDTGAQAEQATIGDQVMESFTEVGCACQPRQITSEHDVAGTLAQRYLKFATQVHLSSR
ncbi:hypothetical protein ACM14_02000 [Delftia sp. JD2]|nr:hypothetical protein ACM14_02000 [Delftia sp. JD2]